MKQISKANQISEVRFIVYNLISGVAEDRSLKLHSSINAAKCTELQLLKSLFNHEIDTSKLKFITHITLFF